MSKFLFPEETPEEKAKRDAENIEKLRQETLDSIEYIPLPNVAVENFKVIDSYKSFSFRPITILTGQNSSGKSSLIELINILSKNQNIENIRLNEFGVKIGSFSNAVSKGNISQEFTISYQSKPNNFDKGLNITATYRVNSTNKQQADICYYNIENENETILEIRRNEENLTSGYINFPYLWNTFKNIFLKYKELKNLESKSGYEDEFGNKVSTELFHSNNFFVKRESKDNKEIDFIISDFDDFPIFYFNSIFNNSELTEEFLNFFKPEFSDIKEWEEDLFRNFHFTDFEIGASALVKTTLNVIKESPFNLFMSRKGLNFLSDANPEYQYLSHIENEIKWINPDEFIYNQKYLKFIGVREDDINILFSDELLTIHHGRRMEYDYYKAIGDKRISEKTKEILRTVKRKDRLRQNFGNFLYQELIFPIENALPKSPLFIPVNRASQKIVLQNLGSPYNYDNFLQQASVKYLELTARQKQEIDSTISYIVKSIFNFADSAKVISREKTLDIIISKGKIDFNIAEEGFGISQLFSMVLGICVQAVEQFSDDEIIEHHIPHPEFNMFKQKSLLVCIEEPESNLHPNYQSKLADMFIYLAKELNAQFIIETHSEYIIRRLRFLTHLWYKNKDEGTYLGAPKEFWKAYYFNKKEKVTLENPQIFEIYVSDENGNLNREFGEGFLDIATEAELENLKLLKINNN